MFEIKPTIGEKQSVFEASEKKMLFLLECEYVIVESHILGEEQPQCVGCNAPFTVRLFLLKCDDFVQMRNKYAHVNNMKQLFQDKSVANIMVFLRILVLIFKIKYNRVNSLVILTVCVLTIIYCNIL